MPELARPLTRLNATAMVAGTIIGASIFVQPSEIARYLATPTSIMTAWVLCGVLTLFGALVCAELASAFPETGGMYVFLREAFSPLAGFLWGWAMFWSVHSGIIAAIAMVFARYCAALLRLPDAAVPIIAVAVIMLLSVLNYVGVKAGSRTQTAFTVAKLAGIALIVIVGFTVPVSTTVRVAAIATDAPTLRDFLLAMVAGLFAYGGWHMVTYTAGETTMPARTIPFALLAGVAIVSASYVALNLAYLHVLPVEAVRSSTRIAADAADAVLGRGGAAVMSALVMISSFGALTGIVLTGPRLYYSMARDRLAPRWIDYVHPRFRTPSRAIILQGAWSAGLAATGAYREMFTRVVYTEWLFFALMAAGLFVLRRRPGYAPSYRTWGYPVVPIVFMVSAVAIVLNQFVSTPWQAASGLGLVAAGVPIYYLRNAYR